MLIQNIKNLKCYINQRKKWFCPNTCNLQTMKLINLMYPDWQEYEEIYLKSLQQEKQ
jgi:hypothetical protein